MHEPDFESVARQLLASGIAPGHVRRTVDELRDHFQDLVDETESDGLTGNEARDRAARMLGEMDQFVARMGSHDELKSWAFKHPRLALVVYPLGCLALLPAVPIIAGVAHANEIARWGTSFLLAGLFTAGILLAMQLSIVLG